MVEEHRASIRRRALKQAKVVLRGWSTVDCILRNVGEGGARLEFSSNSGDLAGGVLTSDLPVNTQFLTPYSWLNNGTTAAAVEFAVISLYAEPASLLGSRGSVL